MKTQNETPQQVVKNLRISELAQATGTSPKTIRFYEEVGLLPPARRAENGYRLYDDEVIKLVVYSLVKSRRRIEALTRSPQPAASAIRRLLFTVGFKCSDIHRPRLKHRHRKVTPVC